MIAAGVDIGSLTAKAVIMENERIIASSLIKAGPQPAVSAEEAIKLCLKNSSISFSSIEYCCATGYGRINIPFADLNMSEISCHGMGAFWSNNNIRTIIDIGGQDCKVIKINKSGMVTDFIMNDKCAAGTGRSLEILSGIIGLSVESLSQNALKSGKQLSLTNKCSIFMELEIMEFIHRGKKTADIANAIADAVAKRIIALTGNLDIEKGICITGGVSKNIAVVNHIGRRLQTSFQILTIDPQLAGAVGAAVFAGRAYNDKQKEKNLK